MIVLDHNENCKNLLIKEIINTNNNVYFFSFCDNIDFLTKLILKFKGEDFYKLLVLFNYQNYNGYFFRAPKKYLVKLLNKKDKDLVQDYLKGFLKINTLNEELLKIEIISLNILLENMIIKGYKKDLLTKLEEIKINYFNFTETKKDKIYNFKNKIILSSGIKMDLYKVLKSVIEGNFKFSVEDLIFIKEKYQEEINTLQNTF